MELLDKMILAFDKCDCETRHIIREALLRYLETGNALDYNIAISGLSDFLIEDDIKQLLD